MRILLSCGRGNGEAVVDADHIHGGPEIKLCKISLIRIGKHAHIKIEDIAGCAVPLDRCGEQYLVGAYVGTVCEGCECEGVALAVGTLLYENAACGIDYLFYIGGLSTRLFVLKINCSDNGLFVFHYVAHIRKDRLKYHSVTRCEDRHLRHAEHCEYRTGNTDGCYHRSVYVTLYRVDDRNGHSLGSFRAVILLEGEGTVILNKVSNLLAGLINKLGEAYEKGLTDVFHLGTLSRRSVSR